MLFAPDINKCFDIWNEARTPSRYLLEESEQLEGANENDMGYNQSLKGLLNPMMTKWKCFTPEVCLHSGAEYQPKFRQFRKAIRMICFNKKQPWE